MLIPRRSFVTAATIVASLLSPSPPTNDALILGGFLLSDSAYNDYVSELSNVGVAGKVYAYNDPMLLEIDDSLIHSTTGLLVGHSKGAKTIATWMATLKQPIPCILIEPVDVDPPREAHFSVLDLWESNPKQVASIPTLVISAPFTDTSKRYGKMKNLCAPEGKDARAFFDAASQARTAYPGAAPLSFVEFPSLGHNDVTSSALGGCSNGPSRNAGSHAIASLVARWIHAVENGEDIASTIQQENPSVAFNVAS
jgi:hypothetical protein